MPFCEMCGEEIAYLPFKCKYCGGTFCKKHRLPENHECSFELKHTPLVPTVRRSITPQSIDLKRRKAKKQPRKLKKYLKRQDQPMRLVSNRRSEWKANFGGTKLLIVLIITISILAFILAFFNIDLYFSLNGLFYYFNFHAILTSLFIYEINFFSSLAFISVFFMVIMLFFTYILSRSIEIRLGSFFLFKLFIISSLFSVLLYVILRLAISGVYPVNLYYFPMGFAWGGILGLISYSIYPIMNQELNALMVIIPVRMKGKSFLLIIILMRVMPILFYPYLVSLIYYLPDLGGLIGAYIVFKYQQRSS